MYKQEGYLLMGAAFEVYNHLGYGMAEEVYQQSLEVELSIRNIPFRAKQPLPVLCKGRRLEKHYKPDLFVSGGVIVELKAVAALVPEHEAQLFNYLRIARQPVGHLINFGVKGGLQWKRFIVSDLHETSDGREGTVDAYSPFGTTAESGVLPSVLHGGGTKPGMSARGWFLSRSWIGTKTESSFW